MAAPNGESASAVDEMSSKAPEGMVLPPRNIREIIEKTADFVVRRGQKFEDRVKENNDANSKMSFVYPEDAYHPFYQWRSDEIRAGRGTIAGAGQNNGEVSFQGREERKGPEKPEDYTFSARMPIISAKDFDVVNLTALFTAALGDSWKTDLSRQNMSEAQFDFLRASHSFTPFYVRLVEQYKNLLDLGSEAATKSQEKRITELEANVQNRWRILDRAKKRVDWIKHNEAQKVAQEEQQEKERVAFAQIDWHDFVVVETIVFDESDEHVAEPPSLNDLQSASLEQKAARAIDPGRRLEEAMPGFDDDSQYYGQTTMPQPQYTLTNQMPPPLGYAPQPSPAQPQQAYQMPQAQQEPNRLSSLQADRDRARAAQEAAKANQPMKIRKDYVPAAQARKQVQNTSICPNCKQAIPNEEMQRHLQIEMLDPQWREQSRKAQQRSITTNLSTQEVANNLKRLASQRTDLFDPVTGQALSQEEQERRKRAELQAYDGVSTMPNPHAIAGMGSGAPGTMNLASAQDGKGNIDVQEQIRQLHQKYKT